MEKDYYFSDLISMIKPPVTAVQPRSITMENIVGQDCLVVILHTITANGLVQEL